jgi:hypothetical protein
MHLRKLGESTTKVVVEEDHFIAIVSHQKRPQCIRLVPRAILSNDPFRWVFEWIADVMEVNVRSRLERRQHVKELIRDIALGLQYMRGVNEQDVVTFQLPEDGQGASWTFRSITERDRSPLFNSAAAARETAQ